MCEEKTHKEMTEQETVKEGREEEEEGRIES